MFKRRASRLKQQLAVVLMVTLALQGSFMAAAGGWTFDKETEIWTYHESEQLTNRVEDLKKGWFHDPVDGYWYYFNEDTGHMLYGWQRLAGTSYHFADIRNRENYFEEADGFWYYRENGRVPFGALLRQEASSSGGGSGVPSTKPETVLPEQPTEPQKPEKEETPQQPEKPETPEFPTEPEKPVEPEVPEKPEPEKPETERPEPEKSEPEQPEPEPEPPTEPEVPEVPEEPDAPPCIVTDPWEEIVKHPTIYEDCVVEQCEKELLVAGYRVLQGDEEQPPVATDSCTEPVMVSVIGIETDGKGTATFAMAEVSDAFTMPMNAAPYYCYLRLETFDSFSTGGWKESLALAALNGGRYSYAVNDQQTYSLKFDGFKLYYKDEKGKKRALNPIPVNKMSGAGYLFEMSYGHQDGFGSPDDEFPRDKVKTKLWLLSELELTGDNAFSIHGEGEHYPYAKQLEEEHWLRSAATHELSEEGYFVTNRDMTGADLTLPVRFGFVLR